MDLLQHANNEVFFAFFVDKDDGVSELTGLTIANTDVRLRKYGASTFAAKHSGGLTYKSVGTYYGYFDSTDTDTAGPMDGMVWMGSALPVKMHFDVLTASAWDAKYGTTIGQVLYSKLLSVQLVVDSVLGTVNSVKAMTSQTYTYGALTSQLTSVQLAADHIYSVVNSDHQAIASVLISLAALNDITAADVWAVGTRALTDSVARTSQLTSVQTIVDLAATTSQLTSVQLVVDAGAAGITTSQIWEYTNRSLTDSVARESQLTSVQAIVDSNYQAIASILVSLAALNDIAAADVWAVGTRALTDSVARESQLTSVQLAVDPINSIIGSTYQGVNSVLTSLAALNDIAAADVWAVGTRELTDYSEAAIADAVWDEVLTAATHNVATSAGRRVREMAGSIILTGISPGTGNTAVRIELDASASTTDGAYDPAVIFISSGTGAGQCRQIFEYDGTNKYAYVNRDWKVIPDATSEYTIVAHSGNTHVNEGVATGGANTSITLNALASADDDAYVDQVVFILAGTGQDQARKVTAYNGTTKIATVDAAWETNPAAGSIYAILPYYNTASAGGDATAANQTLILASLTDAKGATFDTATDSLEAIRNRGDSAWVTGGGMAGANAVALTTQDGSGNNIVEASVEVYDSAGTTFYEKQFSDSSGETEFQMDDGIYIIKVHKAGYSFTNTTLTVSGATSQTITGTASSIDPPSDPTLCRIGMYIKYQDGTIPTSVESSLDIVELPYTDDNTAYLGVAYEATYSADTGLIYWDIKQGTVCRISIHEAGIDAVKITIPATATAEIEDLI